ncbi:MAG: hypothetical protein ACRCYU_03145 [Nocardioides sp.]
MTTADLTDLAASLAASAVRNTASIAFSRIAAIRSRRNDQEAVAELTQLVNELIADKAELISIAQAFEQELISQRISDADIAYITDELVPVAEKLIGLSGDDETGETMEVIKSLITTETVTIMQLVGFNFRQAVGDPLTQLVAQLIQSQVPSTGSAATEAGHLALRREIALYELLNDPAGREALERYVS